MRSLARPCSGALAALLAVMAAAEVPYGYAEAGYRNVLVSVQVSLCDPWGSRSQIDHGDTKVSFSKVDVHFAAKAETQSYGGNDPPGGGTVFDHEAGHARFASTNFAHGTSVSLWMEATVRLYEGASYTDVVLPVSANVKAHNRQLTAMCVATHGAPGGFCDSYADDYHDAVHGYDWAEAGFHVALSTRTATGIPHPNLVLMYSSDCFGAAAAAAFGIDDESVDKAFVGFDQNVLAFLVPDNTDDVITLWDVILDSEGNIAIKGYLHQHMEKLLADAKGSATTTELVKLSEAVERANLAFMPRALVGSSCPKIPIKLIGHPSTTTKRVFLTVAEEFEIPPGVIVTWYYFFP